MSLTSQHEVTNTNKNIYVFTNTDKNIYVFTNTDKNIYVFTNTDKNIYVFTNTDKNIYVFTNTDKNIYVFTNTDIYLTRTLFRKPSNESNAGKGTRHFNPLEDYRFFHHWFNGVKTP
jgi:hypothetical protein